jgi:miniconductance mechanosensitive channel
MENIVNSLIQYEVPSKWVSPLAQVILMIIVVFLALFANMITKKIVLKMIIRYIKGNKFKWDNFLMDRKVLNRLANIVPALVVYAFAPLFAAYQDYIEKGAYVVIFLIGLMAVDSLLNVCNDIYRTFEVSKVKPIKGYIQVVKIFIYIVGGIVVVANVMGKSPVVFLSGLGALTAVLMLVFKDSILGLVAGIQLSANDMVRIGDWIEMPKYGADGDVIDISLNTVKVENFDRTITTIPTYALMADSFKNWRGMVMAGGRRIKRSVNIDACSVSFCTDEMIEKFKKIKVLSEYVDKKKAEIEKYNEEHQVDASLKVNGRRMTNLGTFRAYIQNYLDQHPHVHKGMISMVRQMPSGENGIPMEIYVFTNDTNWVNYEKIQGDIFDHIFAVIPEFGLRVFQNPTGDDFRQSMGNHHEGLV